MGKIVEENTRVRFDIHSKHLYLDFKVEDYTAKQWAVILEFYEIKDKNTEWVNVQIKQNEITSFNYGE